MNRPRSQHVFAIILVATTPTLSLAQSKQSPKKEVKNRDFVSKTAVQNNSKQGGGLLDQKTMTQSDMESRFLNVIPSPEVNADDRSLQEEVSKQISETAERTKYLPQDRLNHFSFINSDNAPPIIGWKGVIEEIEKTPKGLLVTVRVTPSLPGGFLVGAFTKETFLVDGKKVLPVTITKSGDHIPKVITKP